MNAESARAVEKDTWDKNSYAANAEFTRKGATARSGACRAQAAAPTQVA
jgi:hypothetical protein